VSLPAALTAIQPWAEGRRASAMKEIQIHRNDIQIFSERNPSRVEQIPNPAEQNPNSNPSLSFAFSMTYVRPTQHFYF
jgi:hypothetical protein